MSELLDLVLEAHGGLDAWRRVTSVDLRVSMSGGLFEIKGHPGGLRGALVRIDPRQPTTRIYPAAPGRRSEFVDGGLRILTDAGEVIEQDPAPRRLYVDHTLQTPWTDLEYLFFISMAFWNYFTAPFLLAGADVSCDETTAWEENGETWRVLEATFGPRVETHSRVQRFFFDAQGQLRRHDYVSDLAKAGGAHYSFDQRWFDGFLFPTHRRVVAPGADGRAALSGPSVVRIDVEDVVITRA